MKVKVIGNRSAVQGFQLAGIQGWVAETPAQVQDALNEALDHPDIGIILVTGDAVKLARERFFGLMLRSEKPLFVEIPGRNPDEADLNSLKTIVDEAIGVKS